MKRNRKQAAVHTAIALVAGAALCILPTARADQFNGAQITLVGDFCVKEEDLARVSHDTDEAPAKENDTRTRQVLLGFGGGLFKIFDPRGKQDRRLGGSAKMLLQYQRIAAGFGLELDASYLTHPRVEERCRAELVPVLFSPFYTFGNGAFDFTLKAGTGFYYTISGLAGGGKKNPLRLVLDAGVAFSHTFKNRCVLGLDAKYCRLFGSAKPDTLVAALYIGFLM